MIRYSNVIGYNQRTGEEYIELKYGGLELWAVTNRLGEKSLVEVEDVVLFDWDEWLHGQGA